MMIRTIGIYLYAAILVIGSIFKLQKAKKIIFKSKSTRDTKGNFSNAKCCFAKSN